jgi:hypothetical protein
MECNLYDNEFFYVGKGICQLDPMTSRREGREVYLLPANSTLLELPELAIDERAKFENGSWIKVEDVSRNVYFDVKNGHEKTFVFGDIVDNTKYTLVPKNDSFIYQKFEGGVWVADLAKYKEHYKQVAKIKEVEKINEGFTYNGYLFDCDSKAQTFISGLLSAVNSGTINGIQGFTTKDNVDVDLTNEQVKELHLAGLIHIKTCHEWKRNLYTQIDACNTLSSLEELL